MKIIAFETCRVTALFPLEEIVPLGGANDMQIIDKMKERYKFVKGPELKPEEIAKQGYKFETGWFSLGSAPHRITDFAVYRDGIVINAPTTDVAEAFLDDVIPYMQKEFSFRDFITKPRRYFQSQIIVEFARPLGQLIQSIEKITASISKHLNEIYEMEIPMSFTRLDFDIDRTKTNAPAAVQRFAIERRTGVPFENERYYCAAPVRTASHLEVLQEIEALIS